MPAVVAFEEHMLFSIGSLNYAAILEPQDYPCPPQFSEGRLVTIIPILHRSEHLARDIASYVQTALEGDDVFHSEFLSGIIAIVEETIATLDISDLPKSWETVEFAVANKSPPEVALLPGPYVVRDGKLRQVFRLYEDEANAFSFALRHSAGDRLLPLRVGGACHNTLTVAVPSRLRFSRSTKKSLCGTRIAVKDIFDVEGFRTSLGSREHLRLSTPASATAPAIEALINAGCQILGFSQMCSTVLKQEPTQSIEYLAPFNPRADGWQSPSGGSHGQACAVAQYDWLDFSIASDCSWNIFSAAQYGCHLNQGNVVRGAVGSPVILFPRNPIIRDSQMDTPCFFGRDLSKFHDFASSWYAHELRPLSSLALPWAVVYFKDFLPVHNARQMEIFYDLVHDAERYFGLQVKELCIEDEWKDRPPAEAQGAALTDLIGQKTATQSYVYTFWKRLEPFWNEYQTTFQKTPYLPLPGHLNTWKDAWNVTPREHEAAIDRIQVYKSWMLETVLERNPNTLALMPLGNVCPTYRDEWPGSPAGDQMLWSPLMLSPILGAPELVIPAGEIPYTSRVSNREEYLPVCISVMGWPGNDLELIDATLSMMEQSRRPTKVTTGRRMFEH